MGCRKLSYYQEEGLEKNTFFSVVGSEKRETEHFFGVDYYPYGKVLREWSPQTEKFKYQSSQEDQELGSGSYYTHFRGLDVDIVRWKHVDPLAHLFPWQSPYSAMNNNPILNVDPDGRAASPIYNTEGNLLGTDDQGLKGDALVLNESDFTQGMSHKTAVKKDLGKESLNDQTARDNFKTTQSSLPSRPDYDGKLTLDEANKWYQTGGGNPLFVDAAKVNLSPVEKSDFGKVGDSFYKNFAFTSNTETGLVYGNIKLTLMNDKGVVKLGGTGGLLDKYNFDYKNGTKNIPRNVATWFGEQKAGKGTGYSIFNYGTGTIK